MSNELNLAPEVWNGIALLAAIESHRYGKKVSGSDVVRMLVAKMLELEHDTGNAPDDVPYMGEVSIGEASRHAQNWLPNAQDFEYWQNLYGFVTYFWPRYYDNE